MTVKKVVSDPDDTTAFTFTATLTYGSAIKSYAIYTDEGTLANNLITDSNGQVTFTLSHNEWKTLTIPEGAKLVVAETLITGYSPSASAVVYTDGDSASESFTINSVTEDDEITFTNSKGAPLTVSKTVSGGMGDTSPSNTFVFTLTVDGAAGGTEYAYTGVGIEPGTLTLDADGKATFTLAHGQSINLAELPLDTTITVTEAHGTYTPTWTVTHSNLDTPTAVTDGYSFKLKGDADLAVDNNLPVISPTGIVLRMTPFLWVMGAGILLLLLGCFRKKYSMEEGGWSL